MKNFTVFLLIVLIFFNDNIFAKEPEYEPNIVAQGAILMDYKTGRVLWAKNEHTPLAMASTTKIMTAIIAIENKSLEDKVIVSKKAQNTPPVKMFLKEGEEIRLKDLLYALMMQSSNDAAVAIAEYVGGDVETFCQMMTNKAKEIGTKDTIFRTPNGLDSLDHHSTAYDMALISRYTLNNKEFTDIINTKNTSFKTSRTNYNIINKNRLLYEFDGANGIKTGYTGKAGHCFVGSATKNDMTLISVVLASGWGNKGKSQKWIDTKSILNYGFNNFKYETILLKDNSKEEILVNKGEKEKIPLYYEKDLAIPIKSNEKDKIIINTEYEKIIEAPIYKDQKIGVAKIYIGDEFIEEINILAKEQTARKDFKSYFMKIIKNWTNILR